MTPKAYPLQGASAKVPFRLPLYRFSHDVNWVAALKRSWDCPKTDRFVTDSHGTGARHDDRAQMHRPVAKSNPTETLGLPKARKSRTLIILGNGPSLRGFDFARLGNFDAIGMNAAYRYWDQIGWYPRYYICLDEVVGLSHQDQIERLVCTYNRIELFVLRHNLIERLPRKIQADKRVIDFDHLRNLQLFGAMPITTGSHATLVGAMLGYKRMLLMGIDCNYVEKIPEAEPKGGIVLELTSTPRENPNYFFADYQVVGDKYNIPNPRPDLHLSSWRAVAPLLSDRKIFVWNGSASSRVDVFPYRSFDEVEAEELGCVGESRHRRLTCARLD